MNKTLFKAFLFIFVLASHFLSATSSQAKTSNLESLISEASYSYRLGEKATNYYTQKQAFNRSLYFYSLAEQKLKDQSSLERAIGDCYFQLGEYPWAILYYQRVLKSDPGNSATQSHLQNAQQKLGLILQPLFSFNRNPISTFFSTYSQKLLFFTLLVTFLLVACRIWFSSPLISKLTLCSLGLMLVLFSYNLFLYFSSSMEGIIVTSTAIYRMADKNQSQAIIHPLPAGSKVKVLQITSDGEWLKIDDLTGLVGYIPIETFRII